MRTIGLAATVVGLGLVLGYVTGRHAIPPLVESDYCYQLLAADRLLAGNGLTSLQPVAPFQPWEWQFDWGYLTQWPPGYPLLVAVVRGVTGWRTLEACRWIGVVSCAAALVGWCCWIWRAVPGGLAGWMLAVLGSASAVRVTQLVNPGSDVLLIALLPFVLLYVHGVLANPDGRGGAVGAWKSGLAGVLSGGLVFLRYVAVFVPVGIGVYLAMACFVQRRLRPRSLAAYGCGAILPVAALVLINGLLGSGSPQSQFNLGHAVELRFDPTILADAWRNFTDLKLYDYLPVARVVSAAWPALLTGLALLVPSVRRSVCRWLARPAVGLSLAVALALLVVLVSATVLFSNKFEYARLARYYDPIKPLYFVLFIGPVLVLRWPALRVTAALAIVAGGWWIAEREWVGTYQRWLSAERPMTAYGQWERCFAPHADRLYQWLREQSRPEWVPRGEPATSGALLAAPGPCSVRAAAAPTQWVVVSNYHEYVALETGLPVLPVPADRATLERWIGRIQAQRGIDRLRVVFVLDSDNRWRSHWIASPADIVSGFGLTPVTWKHEVLPMVYDYSRSIRTSPTAEQ